MKKALLLTSVLALAACGGGSNGGGATTPGGITTPTSQSEFERAAQSNKEITGMVSKIGKDDSYNTIAGVNSRAAGNRGAAGAHSDDAYYLDNVIFGSADRNPNQDGGDFKVQFELDENGKIIGMYTVDDGEEEYMRRVDNENKFRPVEPTDDDDEDDGLDFFTLNLLGKDLGMKYADFGFLEIYGTDDSQKPMFIMPIAGGYDAKKVELNKDDFSNDIVFNGTAIGNVGEANTEREGERLILRDDSAKLTFSKNSGDQVLSAKFDNWYDVTATQYHDGQAQIEFTNGDNIKDDKYRFKDNGDYVNNFDTGKVDNNSKEHNVSVEFDYYGDSDKDPREATGLVYYQQVQGENPEAGENVDFYMGFGGTR